MGARSEPAHSPSRYTDLLCQRERSRQFHRDFSTERVWSADGTDAYPCRDSERTLVAAAYVSEAAVGVGNGWNIRPQADSRILG